MNLNISRLNQKRSQQTEMKKVRLTGPLLSMHISTVFISAEGQEPFLGIHFLRDTYNSQKFLSD